MTNILDKQGNKQVTLFMLIFINLYNDNSVRNLIKSYS